MRITGTFQEIYAGAKNMAWGGDIYGGCHVELATDCEEDDVEILTMAMHLMAWEGRQ